MVLRAQATYSNIPLIAKSIVSKVLGAGASVSNAALLIALILAATSAQAANQESQEKPLEQASSALQPASNISEAQYTAEPLGTEGARTLVGIFANNDAHYVDQRKAYLEAQALSHKNPNSPHFQTLKASLKSYPLEPYLNYQVINDKLHKLPYSEVDKFLDENINSYLGDRLLRHWLLTLERKQHWHDYQSYYRADLNQTDLACHNLKARLLTGDETALDDVSALWNVGRSQPKACDALFKLWQAAGRQTAELTWSRATQALEAGNRSLTRYIAKYADANVKPKLDLLIEIDRYPQHMDQARRFATQTPDMQFIILHGIQRLARKDAPKALTLWERFDAQHLFSDAKRIETQELIIANLSRQGHQDKANELAQTMNNYSNVDMISGLVRDALENLEWPIAQQWIRRLPSEEQSSPRWRYWSTRIAEIQGHALPPFLSIENSYKALASERTFYGFLAADRLNLPYQLEDQPSKVTLADQQLVANSPSISRAKELFALGHINLARQEWRYAAKQFNPTQLQAAGTLAANWGWHRGGIQAMIDAQSWNDLTIRFPLAYETEVRAAAKNQAMDANLLFAIARQESAFTPDAKSPVGALGLMQLMPATAKQTAKKAGIKYNIHDLLTPETNVALGSHYLNEMLFRFNGNPAFAAAAYNAGPHRVDRWLSDGRDQLPLDVWIETIPFRETRGYVQNVIVFSVIYAYRNGSDTKALGRVLQNATSPAGKLNINAPGGSTSQGVSAY